MASRRRDRESMFANIFRNALPGSKMEYSQGHSGGTRRAGRQKSDGLRWSFIMVALGILTACMATTENESPNSTSFPPGSVAHAETGASETPVSHRRMLALLGEIADRTPDEHPYIGDGHARKLRAQLAVLPPDAPTADKWNLYMDAGKAELALGNEAKAIAHYKQARSLIAPAGTQVPTRVAYATNFSLGVALMSLAETQNCIHHYMPSSCILPLRGDAVHQRKEASREAIARFAEVLDHSTVQEQFHLSARWLLNIAYMTIGGYPDQVPESHRLPPRAFQSEEQIPLFENVAPQLGLDTFDMSGGAIADDFDNDGYLDIVVSTWDTHGQMRFFGNERDGTFSDLTKQAGLLGLYGGLNLMQADYDNDDDIDILVLRGAWLEQQHPNSLLRNNGDRTFTDVTFDAGLGEVHYPTQTASWGDYDNDGDLDLYIGNESTEGLSDVPCQLFRNDGDGTFTDVAPAAGVQNYGFTKAVIWGDYDGDRWLDLYVSNLGDANRLYRNNGDGTFTDAARELRVEGPEHSFPSWFWDFDNDGALDLYVSGYSAVIADLAASALGMPVEVKLPRLYRGDGHGDFAEVAQERNLVVPNAPMGANFGDLDNDGFLDFYLGTGYPNVRNIMPGIMYRNRNGARFVDVSYTGGFAHIQKGHGVVFADLDNDGDQDVFEQMGGAYPVDRFNNVLYENPGFGNHFLTVKLVGVTSNRSAIGARIRVQVTANGVTRSIYKHVNSGGTFGANPLRQTIGLGTSSRVEILEVFWPTSGLTQTFRNINANRFIQIVEGQEQYTILTLKQLKLGG